MKESDFCTGKSTVLYPFLFYITFSSCVLHYVSVHCSTILYKCMFHIGCIPFFSCFLYAILHYVYEVRCSIVLYTFLFYIPFFSCFIGYFSLRRFYIALVQYSTNLCSIFLFQLFVAIARYPE